MSNAAAHAGSPRLSFRTRKEAVNSVTSLFHQKVGKLTVTALRELAAVLERSEPDAKELARAVISAAVAEGLPARMLQGAGLGELVSAEDGAANLDAITTDDDSTDWAQSELLGSGETADRIGVSRTTLDNWRRARKVLAFRKGVRNFVYPVRQFDRRGPIGGLDQVREHFADDEDAWEWLVRSNGLIGGAPPIERLRQGHVDDVVAAAEGALDYA
ncbi:MAG: hypothetical protein JO303_13100 [Caulobacteraceae bacterium]|nr:hypothetical protein [Caulobacteraceae bacterium]